MDETSQLAWWKRDGGAPLSFDDAFVDPVLADPRGIHVSPSDALKDCKPIIIVGAPGIGKTTLLQALARQFARSFIDQTSETCPVFLRAHRLKGQDDWSSIVSTVLAADYRIDRTKEAINDALHQSRIIVFIDGLDEIASNVRHGILQLLEHFPIQYPNTPIVVSSRPAGLIAPLSGFTFYTLAGFSRDAIAQYVERLSANDQERSHAFLRIIQDHAHLTQLASNPLMVTLLWQAYVSKGRLPESRASLFADITDYLLSTWDRQKGLSRRSTLTLHEVSQFLEEIAVHQFQKALQDISTADLSALLNTKAPGILHREVNSDDIINELMATGIFFRTTNDAVSFTHLSFLEFYTAKALAHDPRRLVHALNHPEGAEVVLFACGLISDVTPIVKAAIEKRMLMLAAKCISNGRIDDVGLSHYVVTEFRREIGDRFLSLVTQANRPVQDSDKPPVHTTLADRWDRVQEEFITSNEKGKRLEEFAAAFFGQFFKVVQSNLNTEDGELDVLLENQSVAPFWLEFGADIFVECKNWDARMPLKEVGSFGYKINRHGVRLGFVLSVSGFTADALRTMRNQAASSDPLLVPIDGRDIQRALELRENLEEFLKDRIRDIKYRRKY